MRTDAQVVVIGAGWIGMETAAAARDHGAEVTVVEVDTLPLRRVLGGEVAPVFADLHRAHGVTFRFGVGGRGVRGAGGRAHRRRARRRHRTPGRPGRGRRRHHAQRRTGRRAGLDVDNGVVTDAGLRTSDPDIYAAGDVASSDNPLLGRRIRVEHWANALNGGPAAARAMLGEQVVYDRVPVLLLRPVRPGHGVRRLGRAGRVRLGGVPR